MESLRSAATEDTVLNQLFPMLLHLVDPIQIASYMTLLVLTIAVFTLTSPTSVVRPTVLLRMAAFNKVELPDKWGWSSNDVFLEVIECISILLSDVPGAKMFC